MDENTKLANNNGLETVNQFINYCESHAQTDRALFNGAQINALFVLAGQKDPGYNKLQWSRVCPTTSFVRNWTLSSLCREAKQRNLE